MCRYSLEELDPGKTKTKSCVIVLLVLPWPGWPEDARLSDFLPGRGPSHRAFLFNLPLPHFIEDEMYYAYPAGVFLHIPIILAVPTPPRSMGTCNQLGSTDYYAQERNSYFIGCKV